MSVSRRELLRRAGAGAGLLWLPSWFPLVDAAQVSDPELRELASAVRGPVLTPGERGFTSAAAPFNSRYRGVKPAAVVRAAGVADVQATVQWAARTGTRIAVRSGGHSYAGYCTVNGGVVLDLGSLDSVTATGSRAATIGPGAPLIDVYAGLAARGLTVPGGTCPTVGFGGLALGGGYGFASRALGLTCDNVTGVQVVTADGRVLQCDANQNSDLYWACRGGGGGNFGVVTSFQVKASPARRAAFYTASWPSSRASQALAAWQGFAPDAPAALTAAMALSPGSVTSQGQYFGSASGLSRLLGPLRRSGARVSVGSAGYLSLMKRWAGCSGESLGACAAYRPESFYARSDYVSEPLSARGRSALVNAVRGAGSIAVLLDAYGGAINEVPAGATAFVHRDMLFSIQYFSAGSAGAVRRVYGAMRSFVSGQAYQNYIDPSLSSWQRAYYGGNLARLEQVKRAYDPGNLFRFPQSIPLAPGS